MKAFLEQPQTHEGMDNLKILEMYLGLLESSLNDIDMMVKIVVSVRASFGLVSINDGPITELLDTDSSFKKSVYTKSLSYRFRSSWSEVWGLPPTAIDVNKNKRTHESDFLH